MRRRVPLNAVRAFEAAARYKSLVKAADELCVTPTAVSHQIRQLEDFLQTKLFLRKSSRLELTPDSMAYLGKLTHALDLIDEAITSLRQPIDERQRVLVGASASVASLWLMPRMGGFVDASPDIDVTVETFIKREEIENSDSDMWICNWQPNNERRIEPLMEEEIIPVCTPELLAKYGSRPSDVLKFVPLVHNHWNKPEQNGPYPDWERYLREFGIHRSDTAKGPRFNSSSPCIDAAKAGMGAILGRSILIEDALRSGKLVQIGEAYPIRSPYFLVSPWASFTPSAVSRFKDWLFGQVHVQSQMAQRHVVLS
jgi:LysR family transcriptional regulator, glycine cleavage system transcriptional activator